jgi:outer membrane cobalamin receptor
MKKYLRLFFCFTIIISQVEKIKSQSSLDSINSSIFSSLIKEVINIKPSEIEKEMVSIANLNEINANEAPGIVYTISAIDIERNGYRDLMDILMDVPGFNIANDVQNATSVSLRGFWGQEAKILFMIDGMPMNELAYGSFTLYGHLNITNIDKIEIIKGSGSSIYGGTAGLGVINIITKNGKKSNGSSYVLNSGISNNNLSRSSASFNYGSYNLNGLDITASGGIFYGNRSNKSTIIPDSTFVNFEDSSAVNNIFVNFRCTYKAIEYKLFYDDYNYQDTYNPVFSLTRTFLNEIKYTKKFKRLTLTPYLRLKRQLPWNTQYGEPAVYEIYNLKASRTNLGSNFTLKLNTKIEFISGLEYYIDVTQQLRERILSNGNYKYTYNAYAGFLEGQLKSKLALIFLGVRLDKYGKFTTNYSPRLSITKDFHKFHYKIIVGKSFKIPAFQNINLSENASIKPEIFKDVQFELGFRNKRNSIKLNGFITRADDIIIFNYDTQTLNENYINKGFSEIAGGEILFKTMFAKYTFKTSYSNYKIIKSNANDVLVDSAKLSLGNLAIPTHKVMGNLQYDLNSKNLFVINYIFQSDKYSQTRVDADADEYALINYKSTSNFDLIYIRKNFLKFCDINIGVLNILNAENFYVYPYKSGYIPILGMGRELFIQLKARI